MSVTGRCVCKNKSGWAGSQYRGLFDDDSVFGGTSDDPKIRRIFGLGRPEKEILEHFLSSLGTARQKHSLSPNPTPQPAAQD
jgi:hypothetical protein